MTRQRDAALDNLKGLLIISVVYVHFYDMLGQKTALLFTIRTLLLTVQMPLFVFLCGYFGKSVEKRRRAAWEEYLIPFLIFNSLYYIIRVRQTPELEYGLLRPLNMYWFLLALLIIRLLMPELLRIRGLFPLSLVLALGAGTDRFFGRTLSLSRTACFLPFYLMGFRCTREQLERIRRIPVPVVLTGAFAGALLALWMTDALPVDQDASHPFQLVNSYGKQGLEPAQGIAFRLAIYIAAPLLGICILRLVSAKPCLLTQIGRGSMTVYLLHAFPMLGLVEVWEDITGFVTLIYPPLAQMDHPGRIYGGVPQLILVTLYAFLVSWLLSSRRVVRLYDLLIDRLGGLLFRREKTA